MKVADAMQLARQEADKAVGLSSPNPPVGAVVLSEDGILSGFGHTQAVGGPHAEIMALQAAGSRARGGTLICTLEPCAHTGRTGPCATAIIEAGISAVAFAVPDRSAQAAGGAAALQAAGVIVLREGPDFEVAADEALRFWLHTQRTGRPLMTWKSGQSLDGQVAAEDGSSQWITSVESRTHAHAQRARLDAIIVGAGTVRRDNPRLTARDADGLLVAHQPLRVVLSNTGHFPDDAAVFDGAAPTLIALGPGVSHHQGDVLRARGVEVWRSAGSAAEGIDLAALGTELTSRGVLHALVEGGPTTAGSFLSAGLIDELTLYLAPKVLVSGLWPALRGYGVHSIDDAIEVSIVDVQRLGEDLQITASVNRSTGARGSLRATASGNERPAGKERGCSPGSSKK